VVGRVSETDQRDSCHPKTLEGLLGEEKGPTINATSKKIIGKTENIE
jgi:hypothetical protein